MTNQAKNKPKRKRRIGWLIALMVLLILSGVGTAAVLADAPARNEIQALEIKQVDFANLKDGVFTGKFEGMKGSSRNVTVVVTIQDGEISDIRVTKGAVDESGALIEINGGVTISDLFQRVLDSQSMQVDGISGATLTSKTHLKALESALLQAQN